MRGWTVAELAKELKIEPNTVSQRLYVAGIKPILTEKVYPINSLKRISIVPGKGRPKKAAAPEPSKPAKRGRPRKQAGK